MGTFVQIIEFETSKIDQVQELAEDFRRQREAEGDGGGPVRVLFSEDRDQPGRYVNVVEFASYDDAMANSNHPVTQAFAKSLGELVEGAPRFHNLDVMSGWQAG